MEDGMARKSLMFKQLALMQTQLHELKSNVSSRKSAGNGSDMQAAAARDEVKQLA